jgi:CRISPR system Cascade subunit CasC
MDPTCVKKGAFPKEIADELIPIFKDAAKTPDLALFGRMIADDPSWNVDAACQVAHAISTNRVAMDFDFYTAVDDLRPEDAAGSDMMGTVQFNSSCFYRYSVLDVDDLRHNLAADDEFLRKTIAAYLRASFLAIPTGKQNGTAAHNPPSFALAVTRQNGTPISLANAFCKPVRPNGNNDLVDASIEALQDYLQRAYGMCGVRQANAFYIADRKITPLTDPIRLEDKQNLDGLVAAVLSQISGAPQ